MSIEVKTWKPKYGCKSCKEAIRIIESHARISNETRALAIKKIREQAARIEELEHRLAELEEGNSATAAKAAKAMLQELIECSYELQCLCGHPVCRPCQRYGQLAEFIEEMRLALKAEESEE